MRRTTITSTFSIAIAVILLGFLFACGTTTKYVGGVQINEFNQGMWAHTLKASGMNTTQLTAYAKQGKWNSDHLFWDFSDTTYMIQRIRMLKKQNTKVVLVLRIALQHEFDENLYKWHGMIFPTTREQQDEWFYRYRFFVEMWAKICEQEGVEVLAISSELTALTGTLSRIEYTDLVHHFSSREKQLEHELKIVEYQERLQSHNIWEYGRPIDSNIREFILKKIDSNIQWTKEAFHTNHPNSISLINEDRKYLDSNWRDIIANARAHYKGKITMAANYDSYDDVSFWDELDFIGINAYFPLRSVNRQPISDDSIYLEIVDGWKNVFQEMEAFKKANHLDKKPIFFTELGYTQKQFSTVTPWKGYGYSFISDDKIDTLLIWDEIPEKPEERVMAVKALHQVVKQENIPLVGLNYWKLTSHSFHEGHEPFMLLIKKEEVDELQSALSQFLKHKKIKRID